MPVAKDRDIERIALTRVRVFDGRRLTEPAAVVLDGPVIGTDPSGARTVDAAGAVLLPGLIDAHVHLHDRHTLERLATFGVTTALDMGSWPPNRLAALRGLPGLTDIRSPGAPAIGPGGPHARMPGMPEQSILRDPDHARDLVAARVAEGADYLKIVLEAPGAGGPDPGVAAALVAAAHTHGKQVVAHAATPGAYTLALDIGADVITHIPIGQPVADADVVRMAAEHRVAVPTLTMMQATAATRGDPDAFAAASQNVAALYRAGVPILAGTDANAAEGAPCPVPHGESLHHELELLVAAGLSVLDALRAATSLPARHFGLPDRGGIEPGLRADLVLIDGDPLADIRATRNIRRVWCAGTEVKGVDR